MDMNVNAVKSNGLSESPSKQIEMMIHKARDAQSKIAHSDQASIDYLCAHLTWSAVQDPFASFLADLAWKETGFGTPESKYAKLMTKVRGTFRDMKGRKSTGIVEEDPANGIMKIAKPIGVIGALIPCTNPEATPFCKAIAAVKTRNALIMAPHPRSVKTGIAAVDQMRLVLKSMGYPQDLIQIITPISVELSQELMKQSDLVIATGGSGMVEAAYSSGTPAYGVGAGNAAVIIDETADLKHAAECVRRSKTFDHATSCSAENSLIIQEAVYSTMLENLQKEGGYLLRKEEKYKLQKTMWPDGKHLNKHIVAQPASVIADLAGIYIPPETTFLIVEENGYGEEYPFSGEKLSVVLTVYCYSTATEAYSLVRNITSFSGPGHSCGIHTKRPKRAAELGEAVSVSRIMVNQPQCLANSGAWTNGMPMTMTLGCGTWGSNISSENITWKHMLNTTWISLPIASTEPSNEELLGKDVMRAVYTSENTQNPDNTLTDTLSEHVQGGDINARS